ncbi:MAG: sodium:proton antiporter [Clostridiales bacterium]|nr:sodium:proton antiporter [Clostridiales bacterium]
MGNLFDNYYEMAAVILFVIGFLSLLLQKNLIKKIIGLNIMDTAVFLFLAAKGYVAGGLSPIIRNGVTDAKLYINPLPSGLVLTGIVVSVSVTAFFLALTLRLYQQYHTLDIDGIVLKAAQTHKHKDCHKQEERDE